MRLAADEDRISNDIKEHSFQSKLKHWVKDTQANSEKFFSEHFQAKIKDKALVNFFNQYTNSKRENEPAFGSFVNLLRVQNQYIKGLFDKAKNIQDVEKLFNEKLGKEFQQLKTIQKIGLLFFQTQILMQAKRKNQCSMMEAMKLICEPLL
ncbi:MAG: hypothetical protein IPN22_01190 [Bacteroidetes bacterium]|nr:hypothetical protein [Bacteroidota bacterium]